MADPFERYGLKRIVNVSGTETIRGAAPASAEVIEAVGALVPHSVEMAELQSVASEVIAEAYGTEAGCVTGCSAAGIAVAIAACMTARDLARVEQLPDTTGMKDEGGPAARPQRHLGRPRAADHRDHRREGG